MIFGSVQGRGPDVTNPMQPTRLPALLGFLVATFSAAAIGSAATATSVGTWFVTLNKPSWNPPGWLFGPVWTTLYVLMAIAAWRVWRRAEAAAARRTLVWFGAQLALNALWSVLFFGLRRPGWAFAEIFVLWSVLATLLIRFWRADRVAGALWAPYVAWVSFATVLNGSIWWLNR
jgi:benzodiazapine receptor